MNVKATSNSELHVNNNMTFATANDGFVSYPKR